MATGVIEDDRGTISIITANTGYESGAGHAELRKEAISTLLKDKKAPSLVLLQEFGYTKFDVTSSIWENYGISDKYEYLYKGDDASFLYHTDKVTLKDVAGNQEWKDTLNRIKGELKKNDQRLVFAMGSMPMAVVEMKNEKKEKFVCVSYHGHSSVTDDAKWQEIEGMLMLVTTWSKHMNLPLIIGGDFNLEFLNVSAHLERMRTKLPVPVIAHNYRTLGKRERSLKVDFFIASDSLELKEINPIYWNSRLSKPIFDHDPVTAKLKINSLRAHNQINSFKKELMENSIQEDIMSELKKEIQITRQDFKEEIKKEIKKRIAKKDREENKQKIKEKYKKEIEEEIRKGMKVAVSKEIQEEMKGAMKEKIVEDITKTMTVYKDQEDKPIGEMDEKTMVPIRKKIVREILKETKEKIKVEIQEEIEEEIEFIMKDIKEEIKEEIEEEMKKKVSEEI